jgi:hypothetical protein
MNTPETTRRGFLGLAATATGATALAAQAERAGDPELRALISQADLHYLKSAARSEEGIPIGNGRMGTLVWTTPQSLRFQINRVDVYANNS